jgi:glycosidase
LRHDYQLSTVRSNITLRAVRDDDGLRCDRQRPQRFLHSRARQVSIVLDDVAASRDDDAGMQLDAPSRVRHAAVVFCIALAGCPRSQNPHQTTDDGGTGSGSPDAATCVAVPSCSITFTYTGTATSVALHGDFDPINGWTTGVAMTPNGAGGFSVTLPVSNKQVVVYKFVVDGNWIADPSNTRKSPDGFGAFNSVARAACDMCPPTRTPMDWRDGIMYFVVLDRFFDGDLTNDTPVSGAEPPGQYQGGDLAGLRMKIESGYFTDLGVNTIWITSPLDNTHNAYRGSDTHMYSGYHGYWPKDETLVDSHFGSEADLTALVQSAHAHGINILVDYVMNHVTIDSQTYVQNPSWFWPNDNGAGGNCVCGQGCPFDTKCWFDTFLPTFNMTNPPARNWSVENALEWAKKAGIDGFRLDAVKQVDISWFSQTRARVQAEVAFEQPFYMVGETFDGNRDLIKSYVDPQTLLDGQFDFPLRAQVLYTILHRTGTMSDLSNLCATNDTYYGQGAVMSTFLDNHDVPRAIEHALDTPLFDAWDGGKSLAWTGQPQLPQTSSPFERMFVAYTFLMTSPGIPMIYYGTEYGMPGAGDPDNRRFMQWSNYTADQTKLRDRIASLAKLRAAHPALRRGTRSSLGVTQDTWVYSMSGGGETVYVALNRGDGTYPATGLPNGTYTDLLGGGSVTAPAMIPPRSALVLAQH